MTVKILELTDKAPHSQKVHASQYKLFICTLKGIRMDLIIWLPPKETTWTLPEV